MDEEAPMPDQMLTSDEIRSSRFSFTWTIIGTFVVVIVVVGLMFFGFSHFSHKDKKSADAKNIKSITKKSTTSLQTKSSETSSKASITASVVSGITGKDTLPQAGDYNSRTDDPAVGQLVPTFTTNDFLGKAHTVAPGKPYMIAFVAHWCPHCQREVPSIVALADQGKLPSDVQLIAVATGTSDSAPNYPPSAWLKREGWPGLALADTQGYKIAGAFGLTGYPYIVYVSANGKVYERTSGEVDDKQIIASAKAISQLTTK